MRYTHTPYPIGWQIFTVDLLLSWMTNYHHWPTSIIIVLLLSLLTNYRYRPITIDQSSWLTLTESFKPATAVISEIDEDEVELQDGAPQSRSHTLAIHPHHALKNAINTPSRYISYQHILFKTPSQPILPSTSLFISLFISLSPPFLSPFFSLVTN